MKIKSLYGIIIVSVIVFSLGGCTFIFQKGRRSDIEMIDQLSQQVDELTQAKRLLEERLGKEINDKDVRLQMMDKGLVITFVADIIFDSGKATIKSDAYSTLNKVADVLKENVPDLNVGIEGHTDNRPIKVSGWKSNWELSTARALSVLHYLTDKRGIDPERLSAVGYGEYRPVASNDTNSGRRMNRRVEIVILPKLAKVKDGQEQEPVEAYEDLTPQENLK
jgi:chemotaxis protein MotB